MTAFSSLFGGRLDRELGTDDASILFTTARRKAAINEAQIEFAEATECYQRTVTVTAVSGSSGSGPLSLPRGEYNLMSTSVIPGGDFLRLSKDGVTFIYTDASSYTTVLAGESLPQRTVEWLNTYRSGWQESTTTSTTAQLPECFYERVDGGARYLGFYPVPSTGSSASMQIVIPYVAVPQPLTSDTQQPFTVSGAVRLELRPFHQALVHYAAAQLEKLRRDTEASDRQMKQWLGYLSRYLASVRFKGGRFVRYARKPFGSMSAEVGSDPRR